MTDRNQERREYIRHPAELPIRCRGLAGAPGEVDVRNISRGGICFASPTPRSPGASVEVDIESPEGEEGFLTRVAWCRPADDGFLVGVRFLNQDDAFRARLVEQVCHIEAYRRRQSKKGRPMSRATAALEWVERCAHRVPAIG